MWIRQPCPMTRILDEKVYCILDGDFDEVMPVKFDDISIITKEVLSKLDSPLYCMNAVIESKDHYICCPTKKKIIEIKGNKIEKELYESVLSALLFLDPSQDMCSECLYKAFSTLDYEEERKNLVNSPSLQ